MGDEITRAVWIIHQTTTFELLRNGVAKLEENDILDKAQIKIYAVDEGHTIEVFGRRYTYDQIPAQGLLVVARD